MKVQQGVCETKCNIQDVQLSLPTIFVLNYNLKKILKISPVLHFVLTKLSHILDTLLIVKSYLLSSIGRPQGHYPWGILFIL